MTIVITHAKTNNITDWTQAQLDTIIAGGAAPLPPAGTVLNDVVLPSDWNHDHIITGNIDAGGSNTEVQFNDSGAFGGSPYFTFDKANPKLVVNVNGTGNGGIVQLGELQGIGDSELAVTMGVADREITIEAQPSVGLDMRGTIHLWPYVVDGYTWTESKFKIHIPVGAILGTIRPALLIGSSPDTGGVDTTNTQILSDGTIISQAVYGTTPGIGSRIIFGNYSTPSNTDKWCQFSYNTSGQGGAAASYYWSGGNNGSGEDVATPFEFANTLIDNAGFQSDDGSSGDHATMGGNTWPSGSGVGTRGFALRNPDTNDIPGGMATITNGLGVLTGHNIDYFGGNDISSGNLGGAFVIDQVGTINTDGITAIPSVFVTVQADGNPPTIAQFWDENLFSVINVALKLNNKNGIEFGYVPGGLGTSTTTLKDSAAGGAKIVTTPNFTGTLATIGNFTQAFAGATSFTSTTQTIFTNGIAVNVLGDKFSQFGPIPTLQTGTNGTTQTVVSMVNSSATTTQSILPFLVVGEFSNTGSITNTVGQNGINAMVGTATGANGTLSTTTNGGGLRNRYVVQLNGTTAVTMASAISTRVNVNVSGAVLTDGFGLHAEGAVVAAGATATRAGAIWIRNGSNSGTYTTQYGIRIDALTAGTNNWAIQIGGTGIGAAVGFNATTGAPTEYIYSSASSTLDINANTTWNERIGGTIVSALTASALSLTSADMKLLTAGRGYFTKEGTDGRQGTGTLVGGTLAITINGVANTTHRAFVSRTSAAGTLGTGGLIAVLTSNTLTVTSVSTLGVTATLDTSTFSYEIFGIS